MLYSFLAQMDFKSMVIHAHVNRDYESIQLSAILTHLQFERLVTFGLDACMTTIHTLVLYSMNIVLLIIAELVKYFLH